MHAHLRLQDLAFPVRRLQQYRASAHDVHIAQTFISYCVVLSATYGSNCICLLLNTAKLSRKHLGPDKPEAISDSAGTRAYLAMASISLTS